MTTPQLMLEELKTKYTPEIHSWLKTQYIDICSDGDVIINSILNQLNKYMNKNITDIDITGKEYFIEHIYGSYINVYLKGMEPDPWWAS
jgi:hypothetical protein